MKEKTILIGANLNNKEDFLYSMDELENLAIGLDLDVVEIMTQNIKEIHPGLYIGKGKLNEIKQTIEAYEIELAIFNEELTGTQLKNLEKELNCHVIDRTQLILDIFSRRAKTKEAKMQVEIAQLKYRLPRIGGLSQNMARQRGGAIINRGSGETKLELDRRNIEERIKKLNKELEMIVLDRKTQRKLRKKNEIPIVSLVGYTNTGKSTLLNTLSPKQVFEKDMLFATLDTSVRNVQLSDHKEFLLTDTVGFIDQLPHDLIKAFRSTLEEVCESDLLLHIVDYSHPYHKKQMEVTLNTLKEIGASDIPLIVVYNKVDLTDEVYPKTDANAVFISAKEQIGISECIDLIKDYLFKDYVTCDLLIPYEKGNIIHYLIEHANVLDQKYEFNGTKITVECRYIDYERYLEYVI